MIPDGDMQLTGMLTRPKEMEPVQIARAMAS